MWGIYIGVRIVLEFAGIVSTLLTVQLPQDQVDSIIDLLADAFSLPEDIKLFLVEQYLPEIRTATADVRLVFLLDFKKCILHF